MNEQRFYAAAQSLKHDITKICQRYEHAKQRCLSSQRTMSLATDYDQCC